MSSLRSGFEFERPAFEGSPRPERPRFPIVSTLLGVLAMMNVVSVVLTLMK